MIPNYLAAEIKRLANAEKWPIGTISAHLGVHHSVVRRVLSESKIDRHELRVRPSILDNYEPFVRAQIEKYPRLPASRLYQMVTDLGYPGGPDHFRALVAKLRPRHSSEAFLRRRTLPGEEAQVDWADFGRHDVCGAIRRLYVFVMVLSYSRKIFLKFSYSCAMGAFLRAHVQAFEHFGGVARTLLYDNLKSAVITRVGDAIQFNDTLLELANHYRFLPKPVAVARGNEKGRVERAIQYIRTSFFPAREFRDIDHLNAQALTWVSDIADQRPWRENPKQKVCEAFEDEKTSLLPLPDAPFPDEERVEVHSGKTPYVRFDLNDYSIPHDRCRRALTVFATENRVRIVDNAEQIAEHERSWGKGHQIEDTAHILELVERKKQAARSRHIDRLIHACPSSRSLFKLVADQGATLRSLVSGMDKLLSQFGPKMLESAIAIAVKNNTPYLRALRFTLDQQQQQQHRPPPVELHLSPQVRAMSRPVQAHALSNYDMLRMEDDCEP
ncbi:MAG: IS21 family transposase [Polyangiaceae bacterium]|nr:IS21 family transposase [Polyangiaceae bacterium]